MKGSSLAEFGKDSDELSPREFIKGHYHNFLHNEGQVKTIKLKQVEQQM